MGAGPWAARWASTPLLANDRLYIGSFDKSFYEISLDGAILSEYATQNWVWGTPAIDEYGIVYVADLSGFVHALDSERGLQGTLVGSGG